MKGGKKKCCNTFWVQCMLEEKKEKNSLGTLLMARSGRRTRTVLIADRLTLCPSSEYSSILQRGKAIAVSLAAWSAWPWQTLTVYRESSRTRCTVSGIHSLFNYQSLRSRSLRTKWCHCHSTELSHTHALTHKLPSKHVEARTHTRLTFNWH